MSYLIAFVLSLGISLIAIAIGELVLTHGFNLEPLYVLRGAFFVCFFTASFFWYQPKIHRYLTM